MQRQFGKLVHVYDADYAIRETGRKFLDHRSDSGDLGPQVLHFDALSLHALLECTPPGGWDILVDKSTADAIACGEPLIATPHDGPGHTTREPLEVLCENLRQATSADATWLCVSYSTSRFDFLTGAEERHGWRVQSKTPVRLAGSEGEDVVHRPETGTWAWTLQRV